VTVSIRDLPNPDGLVWAEWADFVVGFNPGLRSQVDVDDDWRDFAQRFCETVPQAPEPDLFVEWKEWASALKLALQV